jgi:YggT family protein
MVAISKHTTHVRETTNQNDEDAHHIERSTTEVPDQAPGSVIGARIVYWIGGAIMSLLAIRLVLSLLGANRGNPFADFIYSLSYPFVSPFFGLFNYEPGYGQSQLELATIVAIIFYAILTIGIAKLFTLGSRHQDDV